LEETQTKVSTTPTSDYHSTWMDSRDVVVTFESVVAAVNLCIKVEMADVFSFRCSSFVDVYWFTDN